MNSPVTSRLLWPEILKIGAVFAVIVIHSAAPLLIGYDKWGPRTWWIGNLYDSAARWCIPVFIMLSGAFVIDKADSRRIGRFVVHRVRNVVVPLIIWSAIYLAWRVYANGETFTWAMVIPGLLLEPAYYHLWFLYVLIALYLLAPVAYLLLTHAEGRLLGYAVFLWLVLGSTMLTIERALGVEVYPWTAGVGKLFVYFGYFMVGRVVRDWVPAPRERVMLGVAVPILVACTAVGTYYMSIMRNGGVFDGLWYEYESPNVLMMGLAVLLLTKGDTRSVSPSRPGLSRRVIRGVGGCVPGVYLVHAMVIGVLARGMLGVRLTQRSIDPALGVPAFALATFVLSLGIVGILRLVPLLRYIVP